MKDLIPMAITAALAVFASQAVYQFTGSKSGITGIATKLGGGLAGVWLANALK